MSYTWKDIKLATLQKMFAADGSEIVVDESTEDYIAGMPYAANEGLLRLVTAGKFITKSIVLNHMPSKNLLPDSGIVNGNVSFSADGAKSYYFQYSGIGTATISGGNSEVTIDIDSYGTYTEFKGNYPNDSNSKVTITFHSDYPSSVKDIALYGSLFPTDEDVPKYGKYIKYDLKELAQDFYNLFDNSISYETKGVYLNTTDYYRESDHVLVLPADMPGMYTIFYHAYPEELTIDTEDDYEMPLDPDVAVLLPLYMASALYMDDDLAISTSMRNYFEVGLEALINTSHYSGREKFTSEWV